MNLTQLNEAKAKLEALYPPLPGSIKAIYLTEQDYFKFMDLMDKRHDDSLAFFSGVPVYRTDAQKSFFTRHVKPKEEVPIISFSPHSPLPAIYPVSPE